VEVLGGSGCIAARIHPSTRLHWMISVFLPHPSWAKNIYCFKHCALRMTSWSIVREVTVLPEVGDQIIAFYIFYAHSFPRKTCRKDRWEKLYIRAKVLCVSFIGVLSTAACRECPPRIQAFFAVRLACSVRRYRLCIKTDIKWIEFVCHLD